MIRIFGDVHAKVGEFANMVNSAPKDYEIVQVGDLGIWPFIREEFESHDGFAPPDTSFDRLVYFIDGNHEHFPMLWEQGRYVQTEIFPNLVYVPRGTVMELDGRNVLFLGGGESPDMEWRTEGINWFREETLTYEDVMRIEAIEGDVDMMITHVPPFHVMYHIFGGDAPAEWNYTSKLVEAVWENLGKPDLYCGHLHENRKIGNVTILNELNYIDI